MDYKDAIMNYGEDIKTGTPDSILASLFRTILNDIGMDIYRFNSLLLKYLTRINTELNFREIASIRGNLSNELLKSVMTWKVFMKGLLFLNVQRFIILLTLENDKGELSQHEYHVDMKEFSTVKKVDSINPDYILAKLFQQIKLVLNIDDNLFNNLIVDYIRRVNIGIKDEEISSIKGNLKKELNRKHMTWRVFIKGLMFLNTHRFNIELKLLHSNSLYTTHYKSVVLNMKDELEEPTAG